MKIWQYAVLLHPTEKEKESGKTSELIVPVTSTLAVDQNGAVMQAARAIPDELIDKADRLEVAVRPFKTSVSASAPAEAATQFPERVRASWHSTPIIYYNQMGAGEYPPFGSSPSLPDKSLSFTGSSTVYLNLAQAVKALSSRPAA